MVELIDLSTFLRAVSPHLQQLTTRRQLSCNGITRAKCHAVEFYKKCVFWFRRSINGRTGPLLVYVVYFVWPASCWLSVGRSFTTALA